MKSTSRSQEPVFVRALGDILALQLGSGSTEIYDMSFLLSVVLLRSFIRAFSAPLFPPLVALWQQY